METHKNPGRPRPDPLRRLQPAVKNALTFRNSLRTPLHAFGVDDAGSISLLFFLKHHSQGGSLLPSEGGLLLHSAEASGCVFARIFDPGVRKKRSPLANLCPPHRGGRTSSVSSKYEMRVITRALPPHSKAQNLLVYKAVGDPWRCPVPTGGSWVALCPSCISCNSRQTFSRTKSSTYDEPGFVGVVSVLCRYC